MKTTMGRAVRATLALLLGATLLAGCGGGEDATKARVRLVNASGGYSSLALSADNNGVTSAVGYGASANYNDTDTNVSTAYVTAPGSAAVLASAALSVTKKNYYTVLAYGKVGALAAQVIDDNVGAPDSGKAYVRVINTAPDAGTLDVYLTGASDTLPLSTPLLTSQAYGGTPSGFATIVNGTWRLRATLAGSKTDVRLDVPGLVFGNQSVVTLVLTPGRGGVLVNALLLVQQGGIANAANTQARVRGVAGVSGGGSVSATVGGTPLMTAVGAPALTAYTLVNAGSVPVSAAANGNAASLTAATLAAGGDYTMMVYGPPSAPVAVLLEDDNTLPSVSTAAKLRLVHGVADDTGTLTLKVDLLVAADGVAQGTASPYANVTGSTTTTRRLTLTTPGLSAAIFDQSIFTLSAGANYTFFAVDATSTAQGILAQDR